MSSHPINSVSANAFIKLAALLDAHIGKGSQQATFFSRAALQLATDITRQTETDVPLCGLALRPSADNDMLVVESAVGINPNDTGMLLISRGGALATALDENKSVVVESVTDDAVLGLDRSLMQFKSAAIVPAKIIYGRDLAFVFLHPEENYFGEEKVKLLDAIAQQTSNAIQKHQLVKAIRTDDDRILQVHSESRKQLARELHDGPAQNMAALTMRANFARRMIDTDPERAKQELQDIEKLARDTTKTIRYMLFTMRPLVLESRGLRSALMNLADKIKATYGQEIYLTVSPELPELKGTDASTILFYIAEEAVINAQKHAAAQNIYVSVYSDENDLVLEVSDDGVGLNLGQIQANYDQLGSLGMVNMRERAELLNGTVDVHSVIHKGTTITVRIPMAEMMSAEEAEN